MICHSYYVKLTVLSIKTIHWSLTFFVLLILAFLCGMQYLIYWSNLTYAKDKIDCYLQLMIVYDSCSNCTKLNNIIYPFSLEAVECEHLLFCWQAVILISYDHAKETWFHRYVSVDRGGSDEPGLKWRSAIKTLTRRPRQISRVPCERTGLLL